MLSRVKISLLRARFSRIRFRWLTLSVFGNKNASLNAKSDKRNKSLHFRSVLSHLGLLLLYLMLHNLSFVPFSVQRVVSQSEHEPVPAN